MHSVKLKCLLFTFYFCWTLYVKGQAGSQSDWSRKGSECFAQGNQIIFNEDAETKHIEHGARIFPSSSCGRVNKASGRHRRSAADLFDSQRVKRQSHALSRAADRAVYFGSLSEVIRCKSLGMNSTLEDLHFPRHRFSVALWVQPEGGQMNPATIIGLYDSCSNYWTWRLGIRTSSEDGEKDSVFFLELHSARMRKTTRLLSHRKVLPTRWIHLAAVYDGHRLFLYLDGGRVAAGGGQRGPLFASSTSSCKALLLGGSQGDQKYFRGKVDDLRVIDEKINHREIWQLMQGGGLEERKQISHHSEQFRNLENFNVYAKRAGKLPQLMQSDLHYDRHDVTLAPPSCGITICDDPDVIQSYADNWHLRMPKTVKYRVVNIFNDDGGNPTVTPEQIKRQDKAMNEAFARHNITFKLTELKVTNTTLRKKVILDNCEPEMIGDQTCHCQCQHPITGNDGGDCELSPTDGVLCEPSLLGNGQCDPQCNKRYFNWDLGDCCLPESHSSCRDPDSQYRPYMSLTEYKRLLALPADSDLNVFFANWTDPYVLGIATFPWVRNVHSIMGGIVMQPDVYGIMGRTDNMIHELGHIFGLLHVHHGVSELDCEDPCFEKEPTSTLGDLCADTNPTPTNTQCEDPEEDVRQCGFGPYAETPYRNFMSYANDECMDHFTAQQGARMHCYLDLSYQRWEVNPKPSPVPLPPRVVGSTSEGVILRWVPPIGSGRTAIDPICSDCRTDLSLIQFAESARFNGFEGNEEAWSPLQATGPPDARPCTPSTLAWKPPVSDPLCIGECSEDHILELSFRFPVVPRRLSIWITYNATQAIQDVELVFKDRVSQSLGPVIAQCDMPFTTQLSMEKLLTKVRIHTRGSLVAIDAVMVESASDHSGCAVCPTIEYAITREPQFQHGHVKTEDLAYFDGNVEEDRSYIYYIQTILGSKLSEKSPPLMYTHGQHYCGDGHVNRNEKCDDGNAVNGDGCDLMCKVEEFFRCSGSPSVCVHHIGDGVCEEAEIKSVFSDCGFYTPDGARDQWAIEAWANPHYQRSHCPEHVITGKPFYETVENCNVRSFLDLSSIWTPCGYDFFASDFWIEAYFPLSVVATSVLVYAHTGDVHMSTEIKRSHTMSAFLIDTNNITHSTGTDIEFSCLSLPIVFNVHHDLSRDFYLTKGVRLVFHSPSIGISAVALRSRSSMSHISIVSCIEGELYNPHTGECVHIECERPSCQEFAIKNGNTSCSGLSEGDTCNIHCNPGYELVEGYTGVVCSHGEWVGATACAPVQCGPPVISHAKFDCPDGYSFGKKCKFECIKPAKKIGTGSAIMCEDDGIWSLPEAYCQMRCEPPPTVKNATLTTRTCRERELMVGSQCRYKCHKGFHVVGQNLKRRVMRYNCTDMGSWVGPYCERVLCQDIDPVFHGLYSCTQHNYVGSTCTLKCPGPNRVTSSKTCQQNGIWDGNFTPCKFEPGECPTIPEVHNVTVACLNGYEVGAKCQLSCIDFHHEPVLNAHSSALRNRRVSTKRNVVRQVTCTGQKEWFPNTVNLKCVEKCQEDGIADGFCQAINNRGHCDWDGGDCCASTVIGGVIQPNDTSCDSGCQCKDPHAPETPPSVARTKSEPGFFDSYLDIYRSLFPIFEDSSEEKLRSPPEPDDTDGT